MKTISRTFISGLVTVLPLLITLYILSWFGTTAESLFGRVIKIFLPERFYWRGLGLIIGLGVIFLAGLMTNAWVGRYLFYWSDNLLNRIPVIKTLYGSTRDLMNLFYKEEKGKLNKVVLVTLSNPAVQMIGFLTRENFEDLPRGLASEDTVAVYLPMSYQVGGHTILISRSSVEPIDMTFEAAMRFVLTGGISIKPAPAAKSPFEQGHSLSDFIREDKERRPD